MTNTAIGGLNIKATCNKMSAQEWEHVSYIISDLALRITDDNFKLVAFDTCNLFDNKNSTIKFMVYKMTYDDYEEEKDDIEREFEESLHYLFEAIRENISPDINLEPKFLDDILCIKGDISSENAYDCYLGWLGEKYGIEEKN